jgi:hypothetical protein
VSEDQIIQQVARLMDGELAECRRNPNRRLTTDDLARRVVQGLGLREEHYWDGLDVRPRFRLVTDWQEDAQ